MITNSENLVQKITCHSLAFALLTLVILLVSAPSNATLSLKDALDAALEQQNKRLSSAEKVNAQQQNFTSWLDGVPFVSVSALRSQDALGTNEAEIGLTLPIKSALRRDIEKQLENNVALFKENASRQQALFLSGQIRELVWKAQAAKLNIRITEQKIEMLSLLSARVQVLFESRAVPEYIVLLLEKEAIDSALLKLEQEYQLSDISAEYRRITGLSAMPTEIQEHLDADSAYSMVNHPDIALLDGAWQHFSQTYEASNQKAEPWNVTLTARRIEVSNFDENQIGLGLEIPLSLTDHYSPVQRSEYFKAQTEYQLAKQSLSNRLISVFEQAKRELEFLEAKQLLLDSSEKPIQKLEQIIPTLLNANLENKESVIRSALEVIDARANIELNRIALYQQISMLKQAAGISI
ncbi:hypothetical protein [Glaciecola sp. SC05]|uniref:hypothetical protein n=1 Tax=Glaciecola sp. SC05 TaxID=1987355 RepID=UPI003528DBE2